MEGKVKFRFRKSALSITRVINSPVSTSVHRKGRAIAREPAATVFDWAALRIELYCHGTKDWVTGGHLEVPCDSWRGRFRGVLGRCAQLIFQPVRFECCRDALRLRKLVQHVGKPGEWKN